MATDKIKTVTEGAKDPTSADLSKYALFLGGTNVVNEVLSVYDPLKTGYGRLFMVRKPTFLVSTIAKKFNNFKHILEFGNTAVQGINDITVQTNQIQGGYTGKAFELPSVATDDTNQFTVTVYEFSGSPVREVVHTWINGMSDLLTGLTHYNGAADDVLQSNQTAEFIYCCTDSTGTKVEYACLFANCFPKNLNLSSFNYTAGQHELVEMQIEFSCVKYESIQINKVATALIKKYRLLTNSLNFYSGYSLSGQGANNGKIAIGNGFAEGNFWYNEKTGKLAKVNPPGYLSRLNNANDNTLYSDPTKIRQQLGTPRGVG